VPYLSRTLSEFKIRNLYAVAALAVRLSALRLVRRPPARLISKLSVLAMAKREADAAFDEAAATRDAKKLKVAELRAALEAAGADTKGLKAELVERLVAAARDGSAEVSPAAPSPPPSAKKAKSPAKPQPDGQKIEIVRLDGKGAVQETLEAPQSYSDARAAFGKLRHATTLEDGGSLELRVGGVAKLSTKDEKKKKKPAKKKAPAGPIPRSACPRVEVQGKKLALLSVNVAGLRALLDPAKDASRRDALQKLVQDEKPDVLCLNEHKLQETHVEDMKTELASLLPDYTVSLQHFTCSTAKKGYSGVAMLIRKGSVAEGGEVTAGYDCDDDIVKTEGRLLTLKAPGLPTVIATYVPNSGQKLDRLQYRCETWDRGLASYVKTLGSSTIVIGDLNCCHLPEDIHNMYTRPNFAEMRSGDVPVEKQYVGLSGPAKQAGLTVEERQSFSRLLEDADLVDAFRQKHPEASGVFSYYSQRVVQNRPMNRGLRLDYVLASPSLKLADAFILSTDEAWPFADHSPVGAVFELD
jgi:exodeoxyribonuclease III